MKKVLMSFIMFALVSGLFSQNAAYKKYVSQAKNYESQGKLVSALGAYYDAMSADSPENVEEAFNGYENLSKVLVNGNPGYGEFDEFDFHDNWAAILEDYELYWTENCPRQFCINKLKKSGVNYEKRTTNYSIYVSSYWTPKYNEISKIITEGYRKAYDSNWYDMFQDWPYYAYTKGDGVYQVKNADNYTNRFLASTRYRDVYNPVTDYYEQETDLYSVTFRILDKQGNVLFDKQTANCGETFHIKDVAQNLVKKLSDDNIKIEVISVDLKTGLRGSKVLNIKNPKVVSAYDNDKFLENHLKEIRKLYNGGFEKILKDYESALKAIDLSGYRAGEELDTEWDNFCSRLNEYYEGIEPDANEGWDEWYSNKDADWEKGYELKEKYEDLYIDALYNSPSENYSNALSDDYLDYYSNYLNIYQSILDEYSNLYGNSEYSDSYEDALQSYADAYEELMNAYGGSYNFW